MLDTAVILAGGYGKRMSPISDYIPKPLIQIGAKSLIDHNIDKLKLIGIKNIYVTYGHKSELLVNHIEKNVSGLINTNGKDNCWFLFNSLIKHINNYILVLPCDIIYDLDFESLKKELFEHKSYIVPVPFLAGLEADDISFSKDRHINKIDRSGVGYSGFCASGLQVCHPLYINDSFKPQNKWSDLWDEMIASRNLFASKTCAQNWKTYNSLSDLPK
jgi:NDP-sugar pyrophosphorylase family protein